MLNKSFFLIPRMKKLIFYSFWYTKICVILRYIEWYNHFLIWPGGSKVMRKKNDKHSQRNFDRCTKFLILVFARWILIWAASWLEKLSWIYIITYSTRKKRFCDIIELFGCCPKFETFSKIRIFCIRTILWWNQHFFFP